MAYRIYIGSIRDGFAPTMADASRWLDIPSRLQGRRVFIKANLTYPSFRPGVMTTPEALEGVVRLLKEMSCDVTFGEADSGGYNPFSMDKVFEEMRLPDLARKYGVRLVNLSREPQREYLFDCNGRRFKFSYATLFDEIDMTVSMPVPKIHMNTGVSFAFKNLWGCISFPHERLRLHPVFAPALVEISRVCKLGLTVMDGTWGLNRSGPMAGDPIRLNWLLASFSPGAVCNTTARLMQLDPFLDSTHLASLRDHGWVPQIDELEFNTDWKPFISPVPFFLKRKWTDYPGLIAFRSHFWTQVAYFGPLARFLHWLLYLFRKRFY